MLSAYAGILTEGTTVLNRNLFKEDKDTSGANDFDYLLHTWDVVNKRKKVRSLYDDPEANQQPSGKNFTASLGWASARRSSRM
jgi:hypothetical protein